jgi:hypothetical protein|tara:strand:- start:7793 stop:7930 length:138 start_codon:yes stop_codon:yes gene_type:complete
MVLVFQNSKEVTLTVVAVQIQLRLYLIIAIWVVAACYEYGTETHA